MAIAYLVSQALHQTSNLTWQLYIGALNAPDAFDALTHYLDFAAPIGTAFQVLTQVESLGVLFEYGQARGNLWQLVQWNLDTAEWINK